MLERDVAERARVAVDEAGLLLVGEPHGVYETPGVLYVLAGAVDARAIAFEWSHEEVDDVLQDFVRDGALDFERLWTLPESAEFFCGDGRVTAGHFALLERLRAEGRLDAVIAFDRLDPEPAPDDWRVRDRDMAERLLAEWDRGTRLLVLAGAFHARLDAEDGETMAMHLAGRVAGLEPAVIRFAEGRCWSRGAAHELVGPPPTAPIAIDVPHATPATVPGRTSA